VTSNVSAAAPSVIVTVMSASSTKEPVSTSLDTTTGSPGAPGANGAEISTW
jgi:hypothetical protein